MSAPGPITSSIGVSTDTTNTRADTTPAWAQEHTADYMMTFLSNTPFRCHLWPFFTCLPAMDDLGYGYCFWPKHDGISNGAGNRLDIASAMHGIKTVCLLSQRQKHRERGDRQASRHKKNPSTSNMSHL